MIRRRDSWLLLATAVGLFGCPLLLDDQFSRMELSEPDAGGLCADVGCVPLSNGVAGRSGAGAGGGSGSSSTAGAAGSASTGGTTSSAGGAGSADSGGAGGTGGTGGSTGQGGAEAACWTLELTSTTYGSASNCVGVRGSNNVVVDTGTTLELSYDGGDPCFTGTIASTGWGATYEMTFASEDGEASVWNASGAGVTGFEFAYRGSDPPSQLKVIYKDPSGVDNCHFIGPGTTSVPFSVAHPGCSASGGTVDSTRLDEMILAFLPGNSQSYAVDFCVQLRALD